MRPSPRSSLLPSLLSFGWFRRFPVFNPGRWFYWVRFFRRTRPVVRLIGTASPLARLEVEFCAPREAPGSILIVGASALACGTILAAPALLGEESSGTIVATPGLIGDVASSTSGPSSGAANDLSTSDLNNEQLADLFSSLGKGNAAAAGGGSIAMQMPTEAEPPVAPLDPSPGDGLEADPFQFDSTLASPADQPPAPSAPIQNVGSAGNAPTGGGTGGAGDNTASASPPASTSAGTAGLEANGVQAQTNAAAHLNSFFTSADAPSATGSPVAASLSATAPAASPPVAAPAEAVTILPPSTHTSSAANANALTFQSNAGQGALASNYLAQSSEYGVSLSSTGVVLSLNPAGAAASSTSGASSSTGLVLALTPSSAAVASTAADYVSMNLVGGNPDAQLATQAAANGSSAATSVAYLNVFAGVDLVYSSSTTNPNELEYTYVVQPQASVASIRMSMAGVSSMTVQSGNLVMNTQDGQLVQTAPVLYQLASDGAPQDVAGQFVLLGGNQFGFAVGAYDSSRTLYIDPKVTPTVGVEQSPRPPIYYGQPDAVIATVAGGAATGEVDFTSTLSGGGEETDWGSVPLSDGVATLPITLLPAGGDYLFTANYSGDDNYNAASGGSSVMVAGVPTTTTLTSTPAPSIYGAMVTFTATVTSNVPSSDPAAALPTGNVIFLDAGTEVGAGTVNASTGVATYTTTAALSVGDHDMTAVYSGDGNYFTSRSADYTQTVNPAPATTTLTSTPNPSVYGQTVTFTATVSPTDPSSDPDAALPTGSVTFVDGGVAIGSGDVDASTGMATFTTTTALSVGDHDMTAVYSGDGNYVTSTSADYTQTVDQADTTTTLSAAPDPSVYGQSVTFTATVAAVAPGAGTPTGNVTFEEGSLVLGTGTLDGSGLATFSISTLDAGNHDVTAVYSGDANFNTSSADVTQTVNQAATQTTVLCTFDSDNNGTVTFFATITPVSPGAGIPTGTVEFMEGPVVVLSTDALDNAGVATFTMPSEEVNAADVTAVYSGDGNFQPSAGMMTFAWSQTYAANPTITAVSAQSNVEGDNVSLAVQATDSTGTALEYAALNLPDGLSIDSSSGVISGTVAYGDATEFNGSYDVTVIVANGDGGSSTVGFPWTITAAPPTLSNPGDQTNVAGDTVSLQVQASDLSGNSLTYYADNLPSGLSIDPEAGLISGTIDASAAQATPYATTVSVDDGMGNVVTQTFNWTVGLPSPAPALTSPGDQVNAAGDAVDVALTSSDAAGYTLNFMAAGLPAGLSIDPGTGDITGTLSASAVSGSPYSVTVTASDGQASASQTFGWTVDAVALANPGDQSNVDGDSVSLALTGSDNSGATLSFSETGLPPGLSLDSGSGVVSGTITAGAHTGGPYSVTVTDTDGTSSASQTFTWDVGALALYNPGGQINPEGASVSLQLTTSDVNGTPTYSATGLPVGVSLNSSTGLISGTVGLAAHGSSPYTVTVTATDGGVSASQTFVWTVPARVAIALPGPQTNAEGDAVSLQVLAASPGGTLSFSASGLPAGVSINSSTGVISGTIASGAAQSTPYQVIVTVSDGTGSDSATFAWTVSVVALQPIADQSNLDGDSVSLALASGYHGGGTLSFTATGLPPGLILNGSTGEVSGTIDGTADVNSPYSVTVTLTDGTVTTSQTFNWTVNALVSVDSIDDQSNAVGDSVSLAVSAEDAGSGTLTYAATGLPPGLSIDADTGNITGTITTGANTGSPYVVTVTASDGGISASQTFNWSVGLFALANPGSQISVEGQAMIASLQTNNATGATLSFSATGLPAGLSLDSGMGVISGTPTTLGMYQVTVTASDGTTSVSQTFTWQVQEVGLSNPGDLTNTEGDVVSLQLQGVSASGGTLAFSAVGLPDGLSLNASTGVVSGTLSPGAAADGPYTVTVSVSDGTTSVSQQFNWTVNPYISLTSIADQNSSEGASVSVPVSATDAGGATITYTVDGLPDGLAYDSGSSAISGTVTTGDALAGPYVVAVTASDGTYSSSETFNWTVTPGTAPAAPSLTNPGTQNSQTGEAVNLQVQASDAAGYTVSFAAVNLPDGMSIDPNSGVISGTVADDAASSTPYQVTLTGDDGVGETTSVTFAWMVNPSPITVQATSFTATAGVVTGSFTVATFTTPDQNSLAADFSATVNWGDGLTDVGTVSGQNGSFTVSDDHIYQESGTLPVTVAVTDDVTGGSGTGTATATVAPGPWTLTGGFQQGAVAGQTSSLLVATIQDDDPSIDASNFTVQIATGDENGAVVSGQVASLGYGEWTVSLPYGYPEVGTYTATVTVTDAHGTQETDTSTVEVGNVYVGVQSNLTVAQFNTTNAQLSASDCTATVDWGDNTTSAGTVTGSNGVFTVKGTHTYTVDSIDEPAISYPVNVTLNTPDGTLKSSEGVVAVRPPIAGYGQNFDFTAGQAFSKVLATYTEPDVAEPASEFTAEVDWGDGTPIDDSASIVAAGNGIFEVVGTHTYTQNGQYIITVNLDQAWRQDKPGPKPVELTGEGIGTGVAILGPGVVPGNSEEYYKFIVYVPKGGKITNVSVTVTAGQLSNTGPIPLALGFSGNSILVSVLTIAFPNKPLVDTITANYTQNGAAKSITRKVYVVQVTVSTPVNAFASQDPMSSPLVSFPASIQGRRQAVQGRLVVAANIVINAGKVTSSSPGLAWRAEVGLVGPASAPVGVLNLIQVGFMQTVTFVQETIAFPGFTLTGSNVGTGTLTDFPLKPGPGPWYVSAAGKTLAPGASGIISDEDSPLMQFPLKVGGVIASSISDLAKFKLDVAAETLQSKGVLWQEAAAENDGTYGWSVNRSGRITTVGDPVTNIIWNPIGGTTETGTPFVWDSKGTPTQEVISAQSANDVLGAFTWIKK